MAVPGGVRGRLVVTIVLVAALAAGGLAIVAYALVEASLLRGSESRAEVETSFAMRLGAGLPASADLEQFIESFEAREVAVVARSAGVETASRAGLAAHVPGELDELVREGLMAWQRVMAGGEAYLVGGGQPTASDVSLFLFFPEGSIHAALSELRNALALGWLVVVSGAVITGRYVAGGTLAPVAQAAGAARQMAAGRLETRLPVVVDDEFGALAASFNLMADSLETKIVELTEAQAKERRFTSDVAHELRTPLTALVTEASLLEEQLAELPAAARLPAELLVADVGRLRVLVEDLLEISRFDAHQERPAEETFDLGSVAWSVLRSRGWQDDVAFSSTPLVVRSDRRRVERILANLVDNAIVHGGRDVRVSVGRDGESALVEVADHGPGIPSEHLALIFERFYKISPSRTGAGSGLGLAIAAEHAALVGARLDVSSQTGSGTRFSFRLPVTDSLPPRDVQVAQASDAEAVSMPHGASR